MIEKIKNLIEPLSEGKNPGQKLSFGESVMALIICMAIIFMVLIVIMGALYLFKLIDRPKKDKEPIRPVATVPQEDNSEEIVAAIMSAVTVYLKAESDTTPAPFIIKNIKRIK